MLNEETAHRTGGAGWSCAQKLADYQDEFEWQKIRARIITLDVLSGAIESCDGVHEDRIARLDSSDLVDVIGVTDRPELVAKWFAMAARAGEPKAKQILDAYIDKVAAKKAGSMT